MPDVLTHFLLGIALTLFLRVDSREEGILIVFGSVITDIERPFTLLVEAINLDFLKLHNSFHSLLGAICLSFTTSYCFESTENDYWKRFRLIFVGYFTHLLADMTMQPWEELGGFLLYPLKVPFSFNLFWSGFIGFPLIGLIVCMIAGSWYLLARKYLPDSKKLILSRHRGKSEEESL